MDSINRVGGGTGSGADGVGSRGQYFRLAARHDASTTIAWKVSW